MIKIENIDVYGWEAAIRGMRNPMNSWSRSDSVFEDYFADYLADTARTVPTVKIGENDLNLMRRLCKAGSDHRKFLRMINVTMDITAPLYWWKEFDTYKIGTVANSCSTMHMIHKKEFTLDDFSHEHLTDKCDDKFNVVMYNYEYENTPNDVLEWIIEALNVYRSRYIDTNDKKYWWQMIQLLPSSYNQRRTVQLDYEVMLNMYAARRNHKLDEWRELCSEIEKFPYFMETTDN